MQSSLHVLGFASIDLLVNLGHVGAESYVVHFVIFMAEGFICLWC